MLELFEKIKTDFSGIADAIAAQASDVFKEVKLSYPYELTLHDRKALYRLLPDTGELDEETFLEHSPYNKMLEYEGQPMLSTASLYYFYFNYPKLYQNFIQTYPIGEIFGTYTTFAMVITQYPNMVTGNFSGAYCSNKSIAELIENYDNLIDFIDRKPGIAARLYSRYPELLKNVSNIDQMKVVATRLPEIKRPLVLQNVAMIADKLQLISVLGFAAELTILLLYRYDKLFMLNSEQDLSTIINLCPDVVYKLLDESTGAHYRHVMELINNGKGQVFRAILRAAPEKAAFLFESSEVTVKIAQRVKHSYISSLKSALINGNLKALIGLEYLDSTRNYENEAGQAMQEQAQITVELNKIKKQFMRQLRLRSYPGKVSGIKQNKQHLQKLNLGDGADLIALIKAYPEVLYELIKNAKYTNPRNFKNYRESITCIVNAAYYRQDVPAILSWLRVNIYGISGFMQQSMQAFDNVAKKINRLKQATLEIGDSENTRLIIAFEYSEYVVQRNKYCQKFPLEVTAEPLFTLDMLRGAKKYDYRLTEMQNIYVLISRDQKEFARYCGADEAWRFEHALVAVNCEHEIDEHSHIGSSFFRAMGDMLMSMYQAWINTGNGYHHEALNVLKEACRFGDEDAMVIKYDYHKSRLQTNIGTEDDLCELLLFTKYVEHAIRPKPFYYAAMALYFVYKNTINDENYLNSVIPSEYYLLSNVVKFLCCAEEFNRLETTVDVKQLGMHRFKSWFEMREKLVGRVSVERARITEAGEASAREYIEQAKKNFVVKSESKYSPRLFHAQAKDRRPPLLPAHVKSSCNISPAEIWM